jgi:hypothetical protein
MHDADSFVRWCAMRGATLILHGHKHVPYHASTKVKVRQTEVTIDSVGCGSSTAIDSPLNLNILSYSRGLWGVRSMLDLGDGSGLFDQAIQVKEVSPDRNREIPASL